MKLYKLVLMLLILTLLLSFSVNSSGNTFTNSAWDFNTIDSPVYQNWTSVRGNNIYSEEIGYGWNRTVSECKRDHGSGDLYENVTIDFHYSRYPSEFIIHVVNGTYNVTIWTGDVGWGIDTEIYIEGIYQGVVENETPYWTTISFIINVSDNYLNIAFRDKGTKGDSNWRCAGIKIEKYVESSIFQQNPVILIILIGSVISVGALLIWALLSCYSYIHLKRKRKREKNVK